MVTGERVADNVNRALHAALDTDQRVCFLGEDVVDPYGGAFKISRGLSTRHPDAVFSTPISEGAVVGMAAGLALSGSRPIVEVMFGDFITLGFDQLVNFATKSVAMYGHRMPMHMVIRCPVGGNRGYGPTHSQTPVKHLLGVPHLVLHELSPFHDTVEVLRRLLDHGEPCVLFENKTLYAATMFSDGVVDDLFRYDYLDPDGQIARAFVDDPEDCDAVIVVPGGMATRALSAARDLFLAHEITCQVIVPSRLYPIDLAPLLDTLRRAGRICVAEEGSAGGGWAGEMARRIYDQLWGDLRYPVIVVQSADSIIPSAAHLERDVLVQDTTIRDAVREAVRA